MHQSKHVDLHSTFWMGLESHSKKFSKVFCREFLDLDMFDGYKDLFAKKDIALNNLDEIVQSLSTDIETRLAI